MRTLGCTLQPNRVSFYSLTVLHDSRSLGEGRAGQVSSAAILAVLVALVVAGCGSSGGAKYRATITAATAYSSKTVGVAFQVKNVGTASGEPFCIVTAAASSTDGGVHSVTLGSIKPGQYDYVASAGDIVTLSGVDAAEATGPGDTSVKCE